VANFTYSLYFILEFTMKVVADNKIPFLKNVLEPYAEVVYLPGDKITRNDLLDADALITRTRTKCDDKLLAGTKVKFIATATIGFDHINIDRCSENGVVWTNAPGCNSGSVYQYIASALCVLSLKYGFDFSDKTIGIIGHGNVGKKIAKLGRLLGLKVLVNDPPLARTEKNHRYVSLDEIIETCDIITCHVPLNLDGEDKTFHLFDEKRLLQLKPETFFFNCSRGEVVDNRALTQILKNRKIKGALLDVWENEPDIEQELVDLLEFATPHIAGYSADGKANGTSMSVQALSRFFKLPLTDWNASGVPLPEKTTISIDCSGKTTQAIKTEAILFTYNITEDSDRLKKSIGTFEKQRGDYPLRREFHAFDINLSNEHSGVARDLEEMGFKIL
jgi:erythronate-4-phosphate dehydrogenase